jgi:hypothetical protein
MEAEPELNLRAELARIDRDRAETQKFFEESRKLDAERRHFDRQTWQPMAIAVLALVASIFALVIHLR